MLMIKATHDAKPPGQNSFQPPRSPGAMAQVAQCDTACSASVCVWASSERTPLCNPAVRAAQLMRIIPGKKDELAFFSSDDGDVMI